MKEVIRNAKEADFDLIVEMYIRDVEDHIERARRFARDLLNDMNTALYIIDKEIIGSISWKAKGGLNDGVVELVSIGVSSNYQKKGIGTKLLRFMINKAQDNFSEQGYILRIVFLFMEENNETARKFYLASEFNEVCVLSSFYPHENAAIFIKYLKGT
ncbi:MAG: GNAT family N-acetyltransferase [Candidatus Lokiarchaeota archaeon]|nr:GNAT family N-acetyltransferase [Candidatus Lokiarchaeota archaeon]MBD3198459.1 GNAT family N-acetyltransferase [Candidatus Lokiarchaeota archaeon]